MKCIINVKMYFLMKDKIEFKELVINFLLDELDETGVENLKTDIASDSEKRQLFDKLNTSYCMVEASFDESMLEEKWEKIASMLEIKKDSGFWINRWKFSAVVAAAAVILFLVLGGVIHTLLNTGNNNSVAALTTISTTEGEKANIWMSDSSKIIINSGSSFSYSDDYDKNERLVHLKGEAFFDIRTNSNKPFIVKLGDVTITATGTMFNISSYEKDNRIETTLEEGKINVSVKNNSSFDLKPGQQVVFIKETEEIIVRNVTTELYTSWKENKLKLIETPLEEALRQIGRRYNVTFEVSDADILGLKYTATFINETIDEVMQMLKTVSPINYKIYNQTEDDKKYIESKIIITKRNN